MTKYYGTKYARLRNGKPYLYVPADWELDCSKKVLLTVWPGGDEPSMANTFRSIVKPSKVNGTGSIAIPIRFLDKIYWDNKLLSYSIDILEDDTAAETATATMHHREE